MVYNTYCSCIRSQLDVSISILIIDNLIAQSEIKTSITRKRFTIIMLY